MTSRILAWAAHAYTATGLVCAALIAVLLVRGGDQAYRLSFLLMAVATFVDATDGWLARRARVGEVTPGFDGRRLDDLVDFLTYTCLPLLLIWRAGLVGDGNGWWLLAPLVASAYGFCQTNAKTEDHYFLGFPSYWNIVALYLYLLRPPQVASLALVVVLAILTFVPSLYLYPSRGGRASLVTNLLGAAWALSVGVVLWSWQQAPRALVVGSLAFPAYYLAISWAVTIRRWRGAPEARVSR